MAKATGGFWDKQIFIDEIVASTKKHSIKTHLCEKDGRKYVDIRKYVRPKGKKSGEFTQHTTKGIAIPLEKKEDLTKLIGDLMVVGSQVFGEDKKKKKKKKKKKRA